MWELDITEKGCEETRAVVFPVGATAIRQAIHLDTTEEHTVDLSFEQMCKIVRRFCALTGFDPNS